MYYRTLFIGFLVTLLSSAPLTASAGEQAVPPPKISSELRMDLEIVGTYQAYANLPVDLPATLYVKEVAASQVRRHFLPPKNSRGHSIVSLDAKMKYLRDKIAGRVDAPLGAPNQHNVNEWKAELATWVKIHTALRVKLDSLIRSAHRKENAILVEHGVTSYATLKAAAAAGWQRARASRGAHVAAVIAAARRAQTKVATSFERAAATPSFAGRWERKGGWWSPVKLTMTSHRTLSGTYRRPELRGTLTGKLLNDGKTMRLEHKDKKGNVLKNVYLMRISADDPDLLVIWLKAHSANKEILRRQ